MAKKLNCIADLYRYNHTAAVELIDATMTTWGFTQEEAVANLDAYNVFWYHDDGALEMYSGAGFKPDGLSTGDDVVAFDWTETDGWLERP